MIPQVPGSIKRSHPIDGVVESVVKSKKYVLPLAVLTPEVTAGLVVAYLTDGRFKAPKDATVEIVPGEPVTKTADAAPATTETPVGQPAPGTDTAAPTARRPLPLPVPTTPQ
jgi:hypothetical protein